MKAIPETAEQELERLRKFQDQVWIVLDRYISYYASPKEFGVLRELKKELWNLKIDLWEKQHPLDN